MITELTEDISAATIYYRKKDAMRVAMKIAKTVIDDQDRARKAAVMGGVVASNKALDVALKQVKVLAPEPPVIFFRRRAVATTLEVEDWRWLKSEKLWVGKVQLKAVEKVEPKNTASY